MHVDLLTPSLSSALFRGETTPQLERGQCISPSRKGPWGVLNPNSRGHTEVWMWVWVSLAPTIEEHKDNVNTLCNHRRSPLEHRHIRPGLDARAGSSMSSK